RNEEARLPYFLDYHRRLGVNRFLIVDNDSSDRTLDVILKERDVEVYSTKQSYAQGNFGLAWINALLAALGREGWVLILDADELLIYPDSETVDLQAFTAELDRGGYELVQAVMLDMYGRGSICDTDYSSGTSFLAACPYFDSDSYPVFDRFGLPLVGGARR